MATLHQQAFSILDKLLSDTLLNESQTDRILAIVEKLVEMPVSQQLDDESTTGLYKIRLTGYGANKKIYCIKAIRELTEMGLKEAKEFSEDLPRRFDYSLTHIDAIRWRNIFQAAGSTVEIEQQ